MGTGRLQRAVVWFGVFVMLLALLGLVGDLRGWRTRGRLSLPYAPGRALELRVWTVVELGDNNARAVDSRWIGLWYQRRAHGRLRLVTAFSVPLWPLWTAAAVWAGAAGLAGISQWRNQRARQDEVLPAQAAFMAGRCR